MVTQSCPPALCSPHAAAMGHLQLCFSGSALRAVGFGFGFGVFLVVFFFDFPVLSRLKLL